MTEPTTTPPRCKVCGNPAELHYRGRTDGELHCFDAVRGRLTGQHYKPDLLAEFAPPAVPRTTP